MNEERARLFFGYEIQAAWPKELPLGRLVAEKERHITSVFLGTQERQKILDFAKNIPTPTFAAGPAGIFNKCLFFPEKHPRCVAWTIDWLTEKESFFAYQSALQELFVQANLIKKESREFIPHVTVCRPPFQPKVWQKTFFPVPVMIIGLHLYESLGHSTYQSLWHMPFLEAFQEIEHTADMAFCLRARNLTELHRLAELALAFTYAPFVSYFAKDPHIDTLEDLIADLNAMIAYADSTIGCPLKAVSYHGDIKELPNNILEWEMIIDV